MARKPYTRTPDGRARRRAAQVARHAADPDASMRRVRVAIAARRAAGIRSKVPPEVYEVYKKARKAGIPQEVAAAQVLAMASADARVSAEQ